MLSTTSERLTRAAWVASASTFVALGSHVLGGGQMPTAPGWLVPLVASFAIAVQLSGRAGSLWRLALAVSLSQLAFHWLFALGTPGTTLSAAGHAHHPTSVIVTGDAAHGAHGGGLMTAAHLAAAVITIALLRRTEWVVERVSTVGQWLAARVVAPAPAVPLVAPMRSPLALAPTFRTPSDAARNVRAVRGPPVFSATRHS